MEDFLREVKLSNYTKGCKVLGFDQTAAPLVAVDLGLHYLSKPVDPKS